MASDTPGWLFGGFKVAAHRWYFDPDCCPCWLAQFDEAERPCEDRIEAFHFVGRQRVRNVLGPLLPTLTLAGGFEVVDRRAAAELVAQAEWDPRNGGPACTVHHRAYDSHLATGLKLPADSVPRHVLNFALDWGLEAELQKHCSDDLSGCFAGILGIAREQSPRILEGQPSA